MIIVVQALPSMTVDVHDINVVADVDVDSHLARKLARLSTPMKFSFKYSLQLEVHRGPCCTLNRIVKPIILCRAEAGDGRVREVCRPGAMIVVER